VRDRLPPELAAHLSAELPLLVRGAYYDRYRPNIQPVTIRSHEAFVQKIAEGLQNVRPVDPEAATRAVLGVLSRHLPASQIAKLREALPEHIRDLWPTPEAATQSGGDAGQA
jgi:uncharacterized protein (DUF2267 family)